MLESFRTIIHYQQIVWALKMFGIIFTTLVLSYVAERLVNYLEEKLSHNKTIWDDLLLKSLKKPLRSLIWILGIVLAIKVTGSHISVDLYDSVLLFKNLGIIFCLSWFVWRVVAEYENHLTINHQDNAVDITTIVAVTKLLKITILITAGLMTLQTFGISITGVIAFGGIGGIAIGFAAKDLLANFFGAMMIFFDRPFLVGNYIRSPDRQIEGEVQYVSWRLTHIRTPEGKLLYVPNSLFSTIIIENLSRINNRRFNETIKLRYKDIEKTEKIIAEIKTILTSNKEIDQREGISVNLSKLDKYSVDLSVEAFTHTTNLRKFNDVKQELLLKISDIIMKNNIQ